MLKEEMLASRKFRKDEINGIISLTFKLFPNHQEEIHVSMTEPRIYLLYKFRHINFQSPLYPVFGLTSVPKVSMSLKTHSECEPF